jgi:hypothetical protein
VVSTQQPLTATTQSLVSQTHVHSHVCLRGDTEAAAGREVGPAGTLPILTRLGAGAALHAALPINSLATRVGHIQVAADAVAAREALPALAAAGHKRQTGAGIRQMCNW